MIEVSKYVEFDAGHRVPDHESKCRSPHGHRYKVEAAVRGPIIEHGSETGMVVDFGRLKELLVEYVHDPWDHAMLIHERDLPMCGAYAHVLGAFGDEPCWKHVLLPLVPTAENLAWLVSGNLLPAIAEWHRGLYLSRVTVWETPTCSATWTP